VLFGRRAPVASRVDRCQYSGVLAKRTDFSTICAFVDFLMGNSLHTDHNWTKEPGYQPVRSQGMNRDAEAPSRNTVKK
jgi:hypothetical protein